MKCILRFVMLISVGVLGLLILAAIAFHLMPADFQGDRLLKAAVENDQTKLKFYLWLGADVNYSTEGGTALHCAAYAGNIDLMTFLIAHGARIDPVTNFGITPLWEARENHHFAAEQLLLAHGANPDTSHIHTP